ncbi:Gfo/Idh/MocA family protein [Acetohalobium arabaticum]|uniref:Oxidoreductase domain protein n=1 Tax=Acetohalobium arabaticum (strain ATCC 49924 / DSM 5501 / Z-7288) TaxID=574087 RepID=D9QTB8_ACEAZ|nr:Gfo/Idh/MocA family oxidoreductase [Acetohalobium arabaticum]ADL13618.1 oxidoreductase domain protein [Acetohalobium arabaticum DSM 5501]
MNNRLGFGIIGCGRISPKHVEGIINNYDEAELVAVSDLVPEKMDEAVDYFKEYIEDDERLKKEINADQNIKKYEDYKELLKDDEVDVVTIATETGYHAEITIDALNAGKHVIVEKAMALSTKDADRMIETADKKGLKLAVCHQNRFNPTVQQLREALQKDRFGRLVHAVASVRWNRNDEYYNMDDWHGTLALDGGILMNQCIHNIDMLCWMMGDVERVTAETDTFLRDIETEDAGMAVVRFKNGAIGLIEGTVCVYPRNLEETFNIFGEQGTVRLAGIAMNEIIDWKFADGAEDEAEKMKEANYETDTVYGYGHNLLFGDMIDAIREDRKPLVDGREGKKAMELVLAIYKSARIGQPIELPLEDYSTTTGVESYE